jgi:hypothetical protein
MDEPEVRKICRTCGADVTHRTRHKTHTGEYLCKTCLEDRNGSSKGHSSQRKRKEKIVRAFAVTVLFVAGCAAFYVLISKAFDANEVFW